MIWSPCIYQLHEASQVIKDDYGLLTVGKFSVLNVLSLSYVMKFACTTKNTKQICIAIEYAAGA